MIGDEAPQGESWIARGFAELREQIGLLERSVPDSFAPVVAKLKQTIVDTIATTYTTTERLMELLSGKSNTGHTHPASDITGGGTTGAGFTVGGDLASNGQVTAGGDISTVASVRASDVFASNAPGNNITGTRVAAWLETATGRLGTASSSERFKTNLRPAEVDPLVVLAMEPVFFEYVHELQERERRATLPSPHAQWTPDYEVHTEAGMVAERLHEAGLTQFVMYERDSYGNAMRDDDGEPVPVGIFYEMWSVAQQVAMRHLHTQQQDLERRLAALEQQESA
jgi:hypothetical protein